MMDKTKIWIIKEWQHVYEFGMKKHVTQWLMEIYETDKRLEFN